MAPRNDYNNAKDDDDKEFPPYPGYQNGEGMPLLRDDDDEYTTIRAIVQQQVNYRRVLLSLGAFVCTCLVLGSFVMMHHHGAGTSSSPPSPSSDLPAASSSSSSSVEPNDFDAPIHDGTTLADLNVATAHASKEIQAGCETTVVIVRHCEKWGPLVTDNDNNRHCSYAGHQRAHYLPTLFGPHQSWPAPSVLYALSEDRGHHMNYREVETLEPLARKFGLDIMKHDNNKHVAADILSQLSQGNLCGKVVVISWEHSIIGDLADRLGCLDCPQDYGPSTEFDQVWMIRYVYNVLGTPVFADKHPAPEDNDSRRAETKDSKHKDKKHMRERQLKAKATATTTNDGVPQWSIYSTITYQHFDPLKFSNAVGDYDGSGAPGGKWLQYNNNNGGGDGGGGDL